MRKIFTTVILFMGLFANANAQYNLFDPADVDADGWIWFDTQEKIDKYIGQADNENTKYLENGKLIQLVSADFDPYMDTEASSDFIGADTSGKLEGADAKKGAIKTAPASANMSMNGGGFVIKMPSCTSFNVMLSDTNKVYVRLMGTEKADEMFQDYKVVSARFASLFKPLTSAGQFTWANMETLDSGNEPYFKLASSSTRYAYFQSLTKNNIYIHGLKILTSTSSGINQVKAGSFDVRFDGHTLVLNKDADIAIYTLQGVLLKSAYTSTLNTDDLTSGVYVLKVADKTTGETETQKLIVR